MRYNVIENMFQVISTMKQNEALINEEKQDHFNIVRSHLKKQKITLVAAVNFWTMCEYKKQHTFRWLKLCTNRMSNWTSNGSSRKQKSTVRYLYMESWDEKRTEWQNKWKMWSHLFIYFFCVCVIFLSCSCSCLIFFPMYMAQTK